MTQFATKHVFNMLVRKGDPIPTNYAPLIVIAGTETNRLALHRIAPGGHWMVSHPESGASVCPVRGPFGTRVSDSRLTKREVFRFALDSVEELIERIGSDKFNAVLANPQPK